MLKTFMKTCASAYNGTDKTLPVECGFVPNRITVTNRTELNSMVWDTNTDTKAYFRTDQGVLTFLSAYAPTINDGSDRSLAALSQGFLLPEIADLNDTAGEILDITVERTDI